MYIQYVGFSEAASARTYSFDVITSGATREFTVRVQAGMFRPACLKIQDGPSICFERLRQELQGETLELPAGNHLNVGDGDIQKYLEKQTPRKLAPGKHALDQEESSACRIDELKAESLNARLDIVNHQLLVTRTGRV